MKERLPLLVIWATWGAGLLAGLIFFSGIWLPSMNMA
jgi:hypothetical protein